jgi:hypothetical protein
MSSFEIRRRCHDRLDQLRKVGLRIPDPFDAVELAARTSRCLGQDIELVAIEMPAGAPYGVTLFTDGGGHIIAFEERTSRVHRDHIIGHELAHLILGHQPTTIDAPDAARLIFPTLPPALVDRVLSRTGVYTRLEEQEAETLATLLMEHASQASDAPGLSHLDAEDAAMAARFSEIFEKPR